MKKSFYYITILYLFFSACTPMKKMVYLNIENEQPITKSSPIDHKLKKGDILHVKILGTQEEVFNIFNVENNTNNTQTTSANLYMNGFTIDSDGLIDIPTIGKVSVMNLNIEEAKKKIQAKADKFLINSTIIVKHINFEITILGEVYKPGKYTIYKDNINLFEALGLAGDITDYGNRTALKIIRGNNIKNINLTDQNLLSSSDLYLKSGDVVYIEPLRTLQMRNSKAQIYLSGISGIALIANIVMRTMGVY